jgi:hypothetical protein
VAEVVLLLVEGGAEVEEEEEVVSRLEGGEAPRQPPQSPLQSQSQLDSCVSMSREEHSQAAAESPWPCVFHVRRNTHKAQSRGLRLCDSIGPRKWLRLL